MFYLILPLWLLAEAIHLIKIINGKVDQPTTRPGKKEDRKESIEERVRRLKSANQHRELSEADYYRNEVAGGWDMVEGYEDNPAGQSGAN